MSKPRHSVVYTHGGGRLGNQVLRFIHWIAWARAHSPEVEVLNMAFWPFARYFETWLRHPACVFPLRASRADWIAQRIASMPFLQAITQGQNRMQRTVQAAANWLPNWGACELNIAAEESMELSDGSTLARVRESRVTAFCGWKISSWRLVTEQQSELREYFRPRYDIQNSGEAFICNLRRLHDILIGVFIRQSDYQFWDDGRFYFSSTQYRDWILQIVELYRGKRVGFVVASEVFQDPSLFAGLPSFFSSGAANAGGHWFDSWVQLSLCDIIVTPPSTFSATAAYVGGIPLWPVYSADQIMSFDQQMADGMIGAASHPLFSRSVK